MVRRKGTFRNGSEMRKTVPLWKGSWEAMLPRRPESMVRRKGTFHNGSKMRKTVPLWRKGAKGAKGRKGQDSDREEVTGKRWRYVAKERERK